MGAVGAGAAEAIGPEEAAEAAGAGSATGAVFAIASVSDGIATAFCAAISSLLAGTDGSACLTARAGALSVAAGWVSAFGGLAVSTDAVCTGCAATIGAASLLATWAGSERNALPSCRPASASMIAAAAIRIGLRRALSRSPILSAFTGPFTVDWRFKASASAAAACAARRAAAMKSDLAASLSLSFAGCPRSSRTRFMIALRSGAPEPGSSGRLATFGSSGSSRSTLGMSALGAEPASGGTSAAFLPLKARASPPNIDLRPAG